MRRFALILGLVTGVLFCVLALTQPEALALKAGGGGKKGGKNKTDKGPYYVLVEHTGLDVNCTVVQTTDDIDARIKTLTDQNKETKKANNEVQNAIDKLGGQIAAKNTELAKAKDADAKAAIQKDIDDLKSQVAQKKTDLKPLVKWDDPQTFGSKKECDDFVTKVTADAAKAKAKAVEDATKKAGA